MRITVFTGNQPRHLSLIERMAAISDQVFAVQCVTSLFPGTDAAEVFRKSPVMEAYFAHVTSAEQKIFGAPRFSPANVRTLTYRATDLNRLDLDVFAEALQADHFVVFGAPWIRPPLVDRLVARKAINIHMGMSPWYRGSSCNFWALHDGRADLIGATIHLLSSGLDNGPMLFHAIPGEADEPFRFGMRAVATALDGLTAALQDGSIGAMEPEIQSRDLEIRYSRSPEFTDEVAARFMAAPPSREQIAAALRDRDTSQFLRPFIG